MKAKILLIAAGLAVTALAPSARAQSPAEQSFREGRDLVIIPGSSQLQPGAPGQLAHTNFRILFPNGVRASRAVPHGRYETPGFLACLYGLATPTQGCNPRIATTTATGGSRIIAVVDAFDNPNAQADLARFSRHFGLPPVNGRNFKVIYADGRRPPTDPYGAWELEESLDVQMAHAMAPDATILLVEAKSNAVADLDAAAVKAGEIVSLAGGGGGEVSNSWGGPEYSSEVVTAQRFAAQGVVFVASAGDLTGVSVPAAFPNVIAVGAITIRRDGHGDFVSQIAWGYTGGGSSQYFLAPPYQSSHDAIARRVGINRGTPDLAFDADPKSGVWSYDSYPYMGVVYGWLVIGGTSVGSPAIAGIVNNAGSFVTDTVTELDHIYNHSTDPSAWTDITEGACGSNDGSNALPGYDFCTGIGVPFSTADK